MCAHGYGAAYAKLNSWDFEYCSHPRVPECRSEDRDFKVGEFLTVHIYQFLDKTVVIKNSF